MRRHLNYANVTATLALVFAMSGGALAASHYLINSTKQINPKVLKKLAGKPGATGATGPAGSAGATGKEGPQGKEGPTGKEGTTGKEGPKGETGPVGQAQAFATITPGEPATIQAGSRGVVSATTFLNITCVFLEPSIELTKITPIVTSHFEDVTFAANPGGCTSSGKNGVQIRGYNQNGTLNSTEAFSIVVP